MSGVAPRAAYARFRFRRAGRLSDALPLLRQCQRIRDAVPARGLRNSVLGGDALWRASRGYRCAGPGRLLKDGENCLIAAAGDSDALATCHDSGVAGLGAGRPPLWRTANVRHPVSQWERWPSLLLPRIERSSDAMHGEHGAWLGSKPPMPGMNSAPGAGYLSVVRNAAFLFGNHALSVLVRGLYVVVVAPPLGRRHTVNSTTAWLGIWFSSP